MTRIDLFEKVNKSTWDIVIYIKYYYYILLHVDFIASFDDENYSELLLLGHLSNAES